MGGSIHWTAEPGKPGKPGKPSTTVAAGTAARPWSAAMGLLTRFLTAGRAVPGEGGGPAVPTDLVAHDTGGAAHTLAEATWPSAGELVGQVVDRATAMSVPAVARARNIIAGTVGLLPLTVWTDDGHQVRRPRPWVGQPERDRAGAVTLAWTADDLFFHGWAYWQAVRTYSDDGRPLTFRRISPARVTVDRDPADPTVVRGWRVDGRLVPRTGPGRLVVFQGLEDGLLNRAGTTIATAAALERAARTYADEPVPATVLRNTSAAHLPDPVVQGLLDKWRAARRTRSTAYLDALELQVVGLDPAGMQLVEARQHMAVELARACNLDPDYVGANEGGSSLTYANVTQERRKLVDFTLRHYLAAVEQRLTMDDVTPQGQAVRFDLDDFLRADAQVRAQVYRELIDTGVLTVDEAREREQLAPLTDQEARRG